MWSRTPRTRVCGPAHICSKLDPTNERWIGIGEMDTVPLTHSRVTALRPARAVSEPGQTPFPPCHFGLGAVVPTGTQQSSGGG